MTYSLHYAWEFAITRRASRMQSKNVPKKILDSVAATGSSLLSNHVTEFEAFLASNEPMRNRTRLAWLFRFAALLFVLNSTLAYAGCSVETPSGTVMSDMPCHHETSAEDPSASDECCQYCVSGILATSGSTIAHAVEFGFALTPTFALPHSGIDPPFRPPITLLS